MSGAIHLRRLEQVAEALDLLEPYEPDSTWLLAPLCERGLDGNTSLWVVDTESGQLGGAMVVTKFFASDRSECYPIVLEPEVTPLLGTLADQSRARWMLGPARHVDPIAVHLQRLRQRSPEVLLQLPAGRFSPTKSEDPRVRVATKRDLEALVDLYEHYRLQDVGRLHLWPLVSAAVMRRQVLIAEHRGRPSGALRLVGSSRHWEIWDHLIVHPDARRQGLGWALVHRSAAETARRARRWVTVKHPTNPMTPPESVGNEGDEWAAVELAFLRRYKGEWRIKEGLRLAENHLGDTRLGRLMCRWWLTRG